MDVSFRISFSCCSLFSCEVTTKEYGYEDDSNKTEVQPALELDVYKMNGADFYKPGSEYNQFSSTDSDNSTNGNIDWIELLLKFSQKSQMWWWNAKIGTIFPPKFYVPTYNNHICDSL